MKLIINADDFGLTKGTNDAILELAKLRTLSSTTVMVNMQFADEIVHLSEIVGFGIGLHFNLTHGKPILSPIEIPSLIDEDGNFYFVDKFKYRIKKKLVNQADIIKELSAQYSKLTDLIGNNITHIDSHQEINNISLINGALIRFIKNKAIRTGLRWYNKSYLIQNGESFRTINPSILNISRFGLRRSLTETFFRAKRIELEKSFILPHAMLYAMNNNTRTLLNLLIKLNSTSPNNKVYEVMCHPSASTLGLNKIEVPAARVQEYEILKSTDFQEFVRSNKLLSFSDLK